MRLVSAFLCALALAAPASARTWAVDEYSETPDGLLVLRQPAQGTLTDGFGPRWGRMHQGIDVGILRSLSLGAAAAGTVTKTGWLAGYSGYGQVVIVDVGGGYETMYAHLSRVDVRPGQVVAAGQRIGLAGCTGSCTGTHLHFELHDRGTPIDPIPFLARSLGTYARSQ
jgi:murein DD-endopeptidase MepM/ murein hydrolase activator NlpD